MQSSELIKIQIQNESIKLLLLIKINRLKRKRQNKQQRMYERYTGKHSPSVLQSSPITKSASQLHELSQINSQLQQIAHRDSGIKWSIQQLKQKLKMGQCPQDLQVSYSSISMAEMCGSCSVLKKRLEGMRNMANPIRQEIKIMALENAKLVRMNAKLKQNVKELENELQEVKRQKQQDIDTEGKLLIDYKLKEMECSALIKQNNSLAFTVEKLQHQIHILNQSLQNIKQFKDNMKNSESIELQNTVSRCLQMIREKDQEFQKQKRRFEEHLQRQQEEFRAVHESHVQLEDELKKQIQNKQTVIQLINKSVNGHQMNSNIKMGLNNEGRTGANDYGRIGANDYGRIGVNDYGRIGANDYGRIGANDYGRIGVNDYGRVGANDYGRVGPNNEGSQMSIANQRVRLKELECQRLKSLNVELVEEINSMRNENVYMRQMISNFEVQMLQQTDVIRQYEQRVSQYEQRASQQKAKQKSQIMHQFELLKHQLTNAHKIQDNYLNKIQQLQQSHRQQLQQYNRQLTVNGQLQKDIEVIIKQRESILNENYCLRQQVDEMDGHVDRVSGQVKHLEHEKELLEREKVKSNVKVGELNLVVNQMHIEKQQLQQKLHAFSQSLVRAEQDYQSKLYSAYHQVQQKESQIASHKQTIPFEEKAFSTQKEQLARQLSRIELELEALKGSNRSQPQNISPLQNNSQLSQNVLKLNAQNQSLKESLAQIHNELHQSISQLEKSQKLNIFLQNQNKRLNQSLLEQKQHNNLLAKELNTSKEDVMRLQQQKRVFEHQKQVYQTQIQLLKASLKSSSQSQRISYEQSARLDSQQSARLEKTGEELLAMGKKCQFIEGINQALKKEITEKDTRVNQANIAIERLTSIKTQLTVALKDRELEVTQLQTKINQLEHEQNAAKQDWDRQQILITTEKSSTGTHLSQLESLLNQKDSLLIISNKQMTQAQSRAQQTKVKLASNLQKLALNQAELSSTVFRLREFQNNFNLSQAKLQSTQHQLQSTKESLAQSQKAFADTQQLLSSAQTQLSAKQTQLLNSQAQLSACQTELLNSKNKLAEAEIDFEQRYFELKVKQQGLEEKLKIMNEQKELLMSQLNVLNQENRNLFEENKKLFQKNINLTDQVAALHREVQTMQYQLAQSRSLYGSPLEQPHKAVASVQYEATEGDCQQIDGRQPQAKRQMQKMEEITLKASRTALMASEIQHLTAQNLHLFNQLTDQLKTKDELTKANSSISQHNKTITHLHQQLTKNKSQITKLTDEASISRHESAKHKQEVKRLSAANSYLQQEMQVMNQMFLHLVDENKTLQSQMLHKQMADDNKTLKNQMLPKQRKAQLKSAQTQTILYLDTTQNMSAQLRTNTPLQDKSQSSSIGFDQQKIALLKEKHQLFIRQQAVKQQQISLQHLSQQLSSKQSALEQCQISLKQRQQKIALKQFSMSTTQQMLTQLQSNLSQRLRQIEEKNQQFAERQFKFRENETCIEETLLNAKKMLQLIDKKSTKIQKLKQKKKLQLITQNKPQPNKEQQSQHLIQNKPQSIKEQQSQSQPLNQQPEPIEQEQQLKQDLNSLQAKITQFLKTSKDQRQAKANSFKQLEIELAAQSLNDREEIQVLTDSLRYPARQPNSHFSVSFPIQELNFKQIQQKSQLKLQCPKQSMQFKKNKYPTATKSKQPYSELYSDRKPAEKLSFHEDSHCSEILSKDPDEFIDDDVFDLSKNKQKSILLIQDIGEAVSVDDDDEELSNHQLNSSFSQYSHKARPVTKNNILSESKQLEESQEFNSNHERPQSPGQKSYSEASGIFQSEISSLSRKEMEDRYRSNIKNTKLASKLKSKKRR